MKTNVEKQVAAFDQVVGHCNVLGEMYKPGKESIKVTALTSLLTSAQESIQAVDTAKANMILAVNARQRVFKPLASFSTRMLHALAASDASPELIEEVKRYRDKFRSASTASNATKAKHVEDAQLIAGDHSRGPLSELDYGSKIRNFGMLVRLAESEPSYNPSEQELSLEGLRALLHTLESRHSEVTAARVKLEYARMTRDKILSGEKGIVETAKKVKSYILSVYGANSDRYRMFKSIHVSRR